MLLWSERWWVVVGGAWGTAAAERALPPPPHPGERKESEGVRLTSSVFAYPPLSHRLFARLLRGLLPVLQLQGKVGEENQTGDLGKR